MSELNNVDSASGDGIYNNPVQPYYPGNSSTTSEESYGINSKVLEYFVLAEDPKSAAENKKKNETAGCEYSAMEYIPQRMASYGGCEMTDDENLTKSKATTIPYVPKPVHRRKSEVLQYVPESKSTPSTCVDDTDTPFAPYVPESDIVKESSLVKAKKSSSNVPKTAPESSSNGKQSTTTATKPLHSKMNPHLKDQTDLSKPSGTKRPSSSTDTNEVVAGVKSARIAHKPSYDASLAPQAVVRRVRPTRSSLRQQMAERYEKVAAEKAAAAAAATSPIESDINSSPADDQQINSVKVKNAQLNVTSSSSAFTLTTVTSSSSITATTTSDNLKTISKFPKPAFSPIQTTTTKATTLSNNSKIGAVNRISTEPSASKSISVAPINTKISPSSKVLVAKAKPAELVVTSAPAAISRFTVGKRDKSEARVAHVPKPISAKDAAVLGIISPSTVLTRSGASASSSSSDAQNRAALCKLLMPLADPSARVPLSVRRSTLLKIRAELIAGTGLSAEALPFEELQAKSAEAQQLEKEIAGRAKSNRNIYVSLGASKVATIRREQKDAKTTTGTTVMSTTTTIASSSKKLTNKKYRNLLSTAPATPVAPISHDALLNSNARNCSLVMRESARVADLSREELVHQLEKLVIPSEKLEKYGFPRPVVDEDDDAKAESSLGKAFLPTAKTKPMPYIEGMAMTCRRCQATYRNPQKKSAGNGCGSLLRGEEPKPVCVYHEGRVFKFRDRQGVDGKYTCCKGDRESAGCASATAHVTDGLEFIEAHQNFISTVPGGLSGKVAPNVFALDCEMCYTDRCLALSRVTLLNFEGNVVYDALVKPEGVIHDYNTKFSGIKEGDLDGVTTSLADVQAELRALVAAESILIGHGLDSDFRVLKLFHEKVVDTTYLYPHKQGLPYKRSLRMLASDYLNRIIQDSEQGHDSNEDAKAALELVKLKLQEELNKFLHNEK